MNVAPLAKRRSGSIPARKLRQTRQDQQFLPGALEILESPPSPLAMTMLTAICLLFVCAVVWAYVGQIDVIAVAQGKIQPAGRVKTIQSLETGRILAAPATNGTRVKAGDVLFRLDARDATAEKGAIESDLLSFRAETLRREASIKLARTQATEPVPSIDWPGAIPYVIRIREERVGEADLAELASRIASLDAQGRQKQAELLRLQGMVKAERELIEVLQERVSMRSKLIDLNAGTRASLLDATEILATQKTNLAQQTGQIAEIEANLDVIDRDQKRAFRSFIAENAQKLGEAERQIGNLRERLERSNTRLDQLVLTSPIDGIVQSSTVTTIGQVVTSGEELLRIVPEGAALEVECYLPNKDIGFVKIGQHAVIKLEAFPFTRYGTIDAIVTGIAQDAVPEADASFREQDPAKGRRPGMPAGADRVQNLVYAVTLRPSSRSVEADGVAVPLSAGMATTAEIRTGTRRIIDYLFSPIKEVGSGALHER